MPERDLPENSLLKPYHRGYLRGELETDRERGVRQEIRDRVTVGLHDFPLLNRWLKPQDIEQIFGQKFRNYEPPSDRASKKRLDVTEMTWPVINMIAFVYRGYRMNGMEKEQFVSRILELGLRRGHADLHGVKWSYVESDLELHSLEYHEQEDEVNPVEKYHRGLGLQPKDIRVLYEQAKEYATDNELDEMNMLEIIDTYSHELTE